MTPTSTKSPADALAENAAHREALEAKRARFEREGVTDPEVYRDIIEEERELAKEAEALHRAEKAQESADAAARRVRLGERVETLKGSLQGHRETFEEARNRIAAAMAVLRQEFPRLDKAQEEHRAQLGALKRTTDELGTSRPSIVPLPQFGSVGQSEAWLKAWEADLRRAGMDL